MKSILMGVLAVICLLISLVVVFVGLRPMLTGRGASRRAAGPATNRNQIAVRLERREPALLGGGSSAHEIGTLDKGTIKALKTMRELRSELRRLLAVYAEDQEDFADDEVPLAEEVRIFAVDARGKEVALGPRDLPGAATRVLLLRPLRA